MPKHFLQSKTFWSGVVGIVTGVSIFFTSPHLTPDVMLTGMTTILGGVGAIYGRAVAMGPLTMARKSADATPGQLDLD